MNWKSQRPKFPRVTFACMTVGMYLQIVMIFGTVLAMAVWVAAKVIQQLLQWHWPWALAVGWAGSLAFLTVVWGLPLLVIVLSSLMRLRVHAGVHVGASFRAVQWANYNFYILLVRYTVMNFIRATPLQPWFYRLMGATMGRAVQMNSTIIADCNLLTVGDYSVIGGDATVICHSYERGRLVIQPVVIGNRVDIGLNAVIMPGVTIGDHAVVAAGSVVTKNTQIPAHTVWAGVPAKQIRERNKEEHAL